MERKPTFSIIVPVYNAEKYIRACIESVINQEYKGYELILVDDGSSDKSGEICDEYAKKCDLIRIVHKQNGGVVSARKVGTQMAQGEYIVNLDADDYIAENALGILSRYVNKTHSDVYCFGFYKYTAGKTEVEMSRVEPGLYDTPERRLEIYKKIIYDKNQPFYTFGICPSVWSKIVKKELYKKWQMQADERVQIGEDMLITVPIMHEAKSICVLDEILYHYRVLENSLSHRFSNKTITSVCATLEIFKDEEILNAEEYHIKNQLGAYCVSMVFNHLCAFAGKCDKFSEFKNYINSIDKILFDFLKYYKQRFWPHKTFVSTFLTKHKLWYAIWLICKKRG